MRRRTRATERKARVELSAHTALRALGLAQDRKSHPAEGGLEAHIPGVQRSGHGGLAPERKCSQPVRRRSRRPQSAESQLFFLEVRIAFGLKEHLISTFLHNEAQLTMPGNQ